MQLLTPTGYRDLADCAIGDEVVAFDVNTGAPIINRIEGWDAITPAYFAYTLPGKRAWVQSYEPIDTWGREYGKPWAAGGRWFKLGGMDRLYEWALIDPQTVTPPMYAYRINELYDVFALQGVWANGNVTRGELLKIGDTLYDEVDTPFQIASIERIEIDSWTRMHISGDSSYIADGLTLHNADRYWVGGTGNTSDATNHWSASNGGAPGASAPTSVDNTHWTAASNTTAYTVTVDATVNCADLLLEAAPSVSGTITLAGSASLNLYGNITFLPGMTNSWTGGIAFSATTGTQVITSNGVVLQQNISKVGAAALQLGDNLTLKFLGSRGLSMAAGTFSANGKKVTCKPEGANTGVITGAFSFFDLEFLYGDTGKTQVVTLGSNITVTGTFKYLGNSEASPMLIQSSVIGTPRTITAAAIDAASDFCHFMDITGAGAAAPFATGTRLGDCLGNSGITFTPSATQYFYAPTTGTKLWSAAGNWFLGSGGTGGAGRVPLPQDNVIFNSASIGAAGITVSADMPRLGKDIAWTGVTNTPGFSPGGIAGGKVFGNFTLSPSMTGVDSGYWDFSARSTVTLTSAGIGIRNPQFTGYGGTFNLQDALASYGSGATGIGNGATLNTNSFSVGWVGGLVLAAGATVNAGSSTLTYTPGGGGTTINVSATATFNAGTSTIKVVNNVASTQGFAGGGKIYNNLWLSGAGSGAFNFTGSNTFADLKISDGAKTINVTAGTTQTVGSLTGFEDNAATWNTVSGAGTFGLTKTGGGVIKMRGANVSRMTASPVNTVYAGATGVDGGNNTNVIFNNAPATASLAAIDADSAVTATASASIVAAAAQQDQAEIAIAAGVVSIAAAFDATDSHELLSIGTVQIGAALVALDDDGRLAATSAVQIGAALALTDDDTLAASGYVWRLINDARYLKPVTSNRNVGPVKGIQL